MNRLVSSFLALVAAATLFAAPRSVNDAQDLAAQFLTSSPSAMRLATQAPQLRLAHTALTAEEQPAFYVFNADEGFVLVSADDNTREILGYSETGSFDELNIPSNMKVWFEHYAEEVAWAANNTPQQDRFKLPAARTKITPIQPLLDDIQWNQDQPYNDLCPIDQTDNSRCYTGCVATAAAQIMRYWKHPVTGEGEHTNYWDNSGDYSGGKGKGHGAEYANFGETTYDWDNMLPKYIANNVGKPMNYDETEGLAVATLMYHVGISCDMIYGGNKVGGSGAYTYMIMTALHTYFKYDKGCEYLLLDAIGLKSFERRFMEELKAKRPILMGGGTVNNEGHEFVCDGIDKDGYWHINWGWGGTSDGYFALSALDPAQQGAGGAASGEGFSVDVEAVIGIQPDKGNPMGLPLVVIDKKDYTFSKTTFSKGDQVSFHSDYGFSYGPADLENADIRFAVYSTDTSFIKAFGYDNFSIKAYDPYYAYVDCSGSITGLSSGDYLLAIAFRAASNQDWKPIPIIGFGEFFALNIDGNTIQIGEKAPDPEDPDDPEDPEVITLEVNDAWARYNKEVTNGPWTLVVRDKTDYSPWVQFYFKSGYKNAIAGEYDLADGHCTLWPDGNITDVQTSAQSGTLKVKCLVRETDDEYGKYRIKASFTGKDGNLYKLNTVLYVPAVDKDNNYITLKDTEEEDAIETVVASDMPQGVKTLENGVIVIKLDEKTYNILGTQIQ